MSQTAILPAQRPNYALIVSALEQIVAQLPLADLPDFVCELERLKALTWARIMGERMTTTRDQDELLTMSEVARRLKISPYRAYQMGRQGILKTIRIGKSVRVEPRELTNYLARQGH